MKYNPDISNLDRNLPQKISRNLYDISRVLKNLDDDNIRQNAGIKASKIDFTGFDLTPYVNVSSTTTFVSSSAATRAYQNNVIIPYYLATANISSTSFDEIITLKRKYPEVNIVVILNPSAGLALSADSSAHPDADITSAISNMVNSGVKVLGYVTTLYAGTEFGYYPTYSANTAYNRSDADTFTDQKVDEWYTYYPAISGIFFDEVWNGYGAGPWPSDLSYEVSWYKARSDYARSKDAEYVIMNPGTDVHLDYFEADMADAIIIAETGGSDPSDTVGFPAVGLLDGTTLSSGHQYIDRKYKGIIVHGGSHSTVYTNQQLNMDAIWRAKQYCGWFYSTHERSAGAGLVWDVLSNYIDDVVRVYNEPLKVKISIGVGGNQVSSESPSPKQSLIGFYDNAGDVTYTYNDGNDVANPYIDGAHTNVFRNTSDEYQRNVDLVVVGDQNGSAGGGAYRIFTNTKTSNTASLRLLIDNTGQIQFNGSYKFPTSDGTSGYVLTTNGSGVLSFTAKTVDTGWQDDLTYGAYYKENITGLTGTKMKLPMTWSFIYHDVGGGVNRAIHVGYGSGSYSTYVGSGAGETSFSCLGNSGFGVAALGLMSNAHYNSAFGSDAGLNITTASHNSLFGYRAGYLSAGNGINGSYNTGFGSLVLQKLTTGTGNVAIGYNAGPTANQSNKLFVHNAESDSPLIGGDFSTGVVTFNGAFSFPAADGTANYVLTTNGSGTLSFAQVDHANLANKGTNTHATIDSHIADTSIHFVRETLAQIATNSTTTAHQTFALEASTNCVFTASTGTALLTINGTTGGVSLASGGAINEFSTDGTMAGNSDYAVPTEKAIRTYIATTAATLYLSSVSGFSDTTARQTFTMKAATQFIVKTSGGTNTLYVDNDTNKVAIGGYYYLPTSTGTANYVMTTDGAGNTSWSDSYIIKGTGSPEGVVTATVGHLFLRTNGGTSTTLYVKESGTGNTGWVAK